jgi:3'(2'), 5'-bisphosphate nucleotidase
MENLSTLIDPLEQACIKAGIKIMEIYESDFEVYGKADQSPVTEADRLGEIIITDVLTELTPNIPVVGEEAKSEGKCPNISGGTFWLVDPLDGTKEFIKKGNDFTVNIGLIINNEPALGVVYAPVLGDLYSGIISDGAALATVKNNMIVERKPISVRDADLEKLTIVASKSHRSDTLEAWLSEFPKADHVSIGSSLKFCLIARGDADLYPRLGPTCEWDTAAAHAVLKAAGGEVLAPDGKPLVYGKDTETFLNSYFLCKGDASITTPSIS